MTHPYRGLPAERFWGSAVSDAAPGLFDPTSAASFTIERSDSIATLGSCFAQHVAASLRQLGYRYLLAENPPAHASPEKAATYSTFSARYGNVYTVAQAVQVLQRATDGREFDDDVWTVGGRFVDALRPTVEPGGFATRADLLADRQSHLGAVRTLFTSADVVVFTLGLTEGWRSRQSHAIFPLAPGVAGGHFEPDLHEFFNADYPAVRAGLDQWLSLARSLNPAVRVVVTVSPVPLMATYEKRHVWTSTTYSKATLLAAAQDFARANDLVDYFPSYEIITSPLAASRYYDDNLREVLPTGVAHVMRLFGERYLGGSARSQPSLESLTTDYIATGHVVCDEELLAAPEFDLPTN